MIRLPDLRRYAVVRSLFAPSTLAQAVQTLGFVQADPIRAPARAQDLTLRHRVAGYRAGDLERGYPALEVEEDWLINYGFLPRAVAALLHPRRPRRPWDAATRRRAAAVLEFITARGLAHPREIEAQFAHGRVANAWGGSSRATTELLEGMQYRSLLRVVRREGGVRLYAPRPADPVECSPRERADALLDLVVRKYAPLPAGGLRALAVRLALGAPQLRPQLPAALRRTHGRLAGCELDGERWYWPAAEAERPRQAEPVPELRLLTPFDPLVWDRQRFQRFWGWPYRFEAYTPPAKRELGYYALPLLWGDQVIGWGNLSVVAGRLAAQFGYVAGRPPRGAAFRRELDAELARVRDFLTVKEPPSL
jgi:uncharacterized protein YcaQ